MQPEDPIAVNQAFNAPIEKVWNAITIRDQMIQWYFDMIPAFSATVGFELSFTIHHEGKDYVHLWKVTQVVEKKRLVYDWKYAGYPGASYVAWDLSELNGKTMLHFSHHGWQSFPQDNPDFSRESGTKGWQHIIQNRLREFLEKEA